VVRPHPLQPPQRQALGCDRADHAPAAREPALGHDPGDDLAGHVLAQEPWEVVRIPAIADDDEVHQVETVFGRQSFGRKAGEAMHPEREPPEMLEQIRRTLGEYNFAGQYQQAPAPQGGGMVKAAWFKSYAENERPDPFDRVVQSWDTANKASELSDFSVCTTWGIKGKDVYLLHVLRKRMEYPELKRAVREQCEAFAASVVLIEDKASGTQLIQELVAEGLHAVARYQPQSDKIMRMHAQTAMIENGFVHLPKEAAWLAEYLHELTVFPKGRHDDQVDSTAQMLDWFKQAGREPQDWMWQLYKQQYQAQQEGLRRPRVRNRYR
jgi:predicted phage terminase large subunit-like protein